MCEYTHCDFLWYTIILDQIVPSEAETTSTPDGFPWSSIATFRGEIMTSHLGPLRKVIW